MKKQKTKYQEKIIRRAMDSLNKVILLSETFCPTDGWMKPVRAKKANAFWQRMRNEIGSLFAEIAKEARGWPDQIEDPVTIIDSWKVILETEDGKKIELKDIPEDAASGIDELIEKLYKVTWI